MVNTIVKDSRKALRQNLKESMELKVDVYNKLHEHLVSIGHRSDFARKLIVRQMKSGKFGFFFDNNPNNIISEQDVDTYIYYMCIEIEKYEDGLKKDKKVSEIVAKMFTVITEEEFQYFLDYYKE